MNVQQQDVGSIEIQHLILIHARNPVGRLQTKMKKEEFQSQSLTPILEEVMKVQQQDVGSIGIQHLILINARNPVGIPQTKMKKDEFQS